MADAPPIEFDYSCLLPGQYDWMREFDINLSGMMVTGSWGADPLQFVAERLRVLDFPDCSCRCLDQVRGHERWEFRSWPIAVSSPDGWRSQRMLYRCARCGNSYFISGRTT